MFRRSGVFSALSVAVKKMRLFGIAMLTIYSLVISGCFFPPILEGAGRLPKYEAPYGATYVKPGMTREERLRDLADCGTQCGLSVCFTKEQIANATIPKEQAAPGDLTDGSLILGRKLRNCMVTKGYHKVPRHECSGDQEYFPRCLWP